MINKMTTSLTALPVDRKVKINSDRPDIGYGNEKKIKPHAQVGHCQVAHEKLWNGHSKPRTDED